jgi:hypothetical protein
MEELTAEEKETVRKIEDDIRRQIREVLENFGNRKRAVQAACPHERTQEKSDFDYHKREDWVETYCSDCGKMLSRV